MTRGTRHRSRLVIGRPRTSTLVLIGLFVGFLALYVLVAPPSKTSTGNVHPANQTPTQPQSTPAYTPTPRHHTVSPAPSHSTAPSVSQTPSHTATPAPAASTGTGTATPTTTSV